MVCPRRGKKGRGAKKLRNEGILTFKRDSSSGLLSLEAEGVSDPLSSPRPLGFLHTSPGSVYLVALQTYTKSVFRH